MVSCFCRFSDAHCKKCIVGLLKRAGDAYKNGRKQHSFVMDLMKLDIPELLLVNASKDHDPNVENLFIEMIRGFIQRNALRDTILSQVVPIMVSDTYCDELMHVYTAVIFSETCFCSLRGHNLLGLGQFLLKNSQVER